MKDSQKDTCYAVLYMTVMVLIILMIAFSFYKLGWRYAGINELHRLEKRVAVLEGKQS